MNTVEAHIDLKRICMCFGSKEVLRDVGLTVQRGHVGVVIGGSGTGKTTLLRIMMGLQRPTSGEVWIDGENIAPMPESELRRVRGRCGMVFQYSALLDSLTVMQNVALPLKEHEPLGRAEREARVREMLESLGLAGTEHQYPAELSGGMRKRVGLARALIRKPSLIMYDEPASGLDPLTARRVDDLILETRDRFGVTSVVISHSMAQAVRIADRMYVLDAGAVAAEGTVAELKAQGGSLVQQYFEASRVD
ncbi:MAG: ATP-binding cassette domain-containing protein [Myxococcales bacterium]|nr:ATP-binding cassette domain-containing protein [Myxococcales bacterium]MDD9969605.1 ATP-binding cassette domain-containing protein [Myxococcales bacterium]